MWIQKLKYLWGNYVRHFWVSVGRGPWVGACGSGSWVGVVGRGSGALGRGPWVGGRGVGMVVEGERGDEAWVWKRLHGGAECGAGEAVDKRVLAMG